MTIVLADLKVLYSILKVVTAAVVVDVDVEAEAEAETGMAVVVLTMAMVEEAVVTDGSDRIQELSFGAPPFFKYCSIIYIHSSFEVL